MNDERTILVTVAILVMALCMAGVVWAAAMGTAFTYQGSLVDDNNPADGLYDFEFEVYDDAATGSQQGSTVSKDDVDVIDGHFTAILDFGSSIFTGDARWLQIAVRPGASSDPNEYSTLSPRQEITPTPYALYAETAESVTVPLELSASSSDAIIKGTNTGAGQGVYGVHSSSGNYGYLSSDDFGVYGKDDSSNNYGYLGSDSYGVFGASVDGCGVKGSTTTGYGIYGSTKSSGYAGYFDGDVRITDGLTVDGVFAASGLDADTLDTLDSTDFSLDGHHHDTDYVNVTGDLMNGDLIISGSDLYLTSGDISISGGGDISISGGYLSATTSGNYGLSGETSNTLGKALQGTATGTDGSGVFGEATNTGDYTNYGGKFQAAGGSGVGVFGEASKPGAYTNFGGYFKALGNTGRGVHGVATGTSGTNYGGYFEAAGSTGYGVYGKATDTGGALMSHTYGGHFSSSGDYGRGVYGYASGAHGYGVEGYASDSSGTTYGGYFSAYSSSGRGVYGRATNTSGTNYGGEFRADGSTGRGIKAEASNSGNYVNYGGHFEAAGDDGRGVYGKATGETGYGVYGEATDSGDYINHGGYFEAAGDNGRGAFGKATGDNGVAVYGYATGYNGTGVIGQSNGSNGIGVQGLNTAGGLAGSFTGYVDFEGRVEITLGDLDIVDGDVYIQSMAGTASGSPVRIWNDRLYYQSSSAKYKDDIQELTDDFNKILDAQPKSFIDKATGQRNIGYIAEEFDKLGLDNLVIYKDGQPDALKYDLVSLYLLEVVKDANEENEGLKHRIEVLEAAVTKLISSKQGGQL